MNKIFTIGLVGNAPQEKHEILNRMLDEEGLTDLCDVILYGADGQPELEALQDAIDDYADNVLQGVVCLPMATSPVKAVRHCLEQSDADIVPVFDNRILRMSSVLGDIDAAAAAQTLTQEAVQQRGEMLWKMLKRDMGILNPRIAILSIGEKTDNSETSIDTTVIKPAVEELVKKGIQIFGPADSATIFSNEACKAYDAVLQIYRSQTLEAYAALCEEPIITILTGIDTPIVSTEAEGVLSALWAVKDIARNRKTYDLPFKHPLEKLYHERKEDGDKARFAVKKKGFNPAEHRRENVTFVTKNTRDPKASSENKEQKEQTATPKENTSE